MIVWGIRISGLLLCLICLPVHAQDQALSVRDLVVKGDSVYAQFDNRAALEHYQAAIVLDSMHFDTRIKLSRTSYDYGLDLVAQNNMEAAYEEFQASIVHARHLVAHFPDSAQSHFLLAATLGNLALFKNGREKIILGRMVAEHSQEAISIDSLLAYPYVSLGIYYRELANLSWIEKTLAKVFFGRLPKTSFEQALDLLRTALKLRPNFPFLHFELGKTFLMLSENEEARRHFETLVSLTPETTQDRRNQDYARDLLKNWKNQ
ncbi:MAG: hypothetical protein AAF564_08025 [Bacteroidota bacterium]